MSLLGSIFGTDQAASRMSSANRAAMESEREMFDETMAFQGEIWDWQKEQAAPWQEAGLGALGQYQDTMDTGFSFNPDQDPVYQARVSELDKNLGTSNAARGMKLSGGTLRSLRDMTANELGASYGRQRDEYQTKLSNLGNIMGMGSSATSGITGTGSAYGSNVSNLMQNFSASQSQGYMNQGQIGAQAATAPFQNLMSLGTMAGGMMMGYGAIK